MARDVQIKIGAKDTASKVFKRTSDNATRMSKTIGAITKVAKVATIGIAALAAGVTVLVKAMKPMVDAASTSQERIGAFEVIFGDASKSVKKSSDVMANAMGVARSEMADMMSQLQDLFVPMGVVPELALKMSTTLSALAVDLGSFRNLPTDRVMIDLMAAMTGSGEVMKKYGVILSEAAVKQELFNTGIDPRHATNAEKAQARMNIVMRGTTNAQGDAIRTSDSYANSLKRLKAEWTNLKEAIGKPLLDPLANAMQGITRNLQLFGNLTNVWLLGLKQVEAAIIGVDIAILRMMKRMGPLSPIGVGPGVIEALQRTQAEKLKFRPGTPGTGGGGALPVPPTPPRRPFQKVDRQYIPTRAEVIAELGFPPETERQQRINKGLIRTGGPDSVQATQGRLLTGGGTRSKAIDEAKLTNKKLDNVTTELEELNEYNRAKNDVRNTFKLEKVP